MWGSSYGVHGTVRYGTIKIKSRSFSNFLDKGGFSKQVPTNVV